MNIYIDESGSINNHLPNNKYFIIAMVRVIDRDSLRRSYKRFVSNNYELLKELDVDRTHPLSGHPIKPSGKMFYNNKFRELKGSRFDREMKLKFVDFFSQKHTFEVYYIKVANNRISDAFCSHTDRVFNYSIRRALDYWIRNGILPDEDTSLQLDERNEKVEAKHFLENYLNTELFMSNVTKSKFAVSYYDSAANELVQIADVFANLYYSQLHTGAYDEVFSQLKKDGILKYIYEFPR